MPSSPLRSWCAALLVSLLVLPALPSAQTLARSTPEEVGLSSARLERLGSALQAYVDHGQLAGAVVLVARHGKVAFLRAVGERDRESHNPMRDDTIFRIASQTKAVVSAATLMLQEQGALLLSDPVGKYIPEFQKTTVAVPRAGGGYDVVPAKRPITILDLLTHTSGLSYGGGPARDRWEAAGIQGGTSRTATSRSPPRSRAWPPCRSTRSRASAGSTATRTTCSAWSSSARRECRWTASCASASSSRSG